MLIREYDNLWNEKNKNKKIQINLRIYSYGKFANNINVYIGNY